MSTWASDRLEYLRGFMSRGDIQKQTGIHWRTQESIISGTRTITDMGRTNLNRFYRRTTYGNLRSSGMSVSQSRKYTGYKPASVQQYVNSMGEMVSKLARGALKNVTDKYGIPASYAEHMDLYLSLKEKVLEGLKKSVRVYDQWLDYGRKKKTAH